MKAILSLILLYTFCSSTAVCQITVSEEYLLNLEFQKINQVSEIPSAVLMKLQKLSGHDKETKFIANPSDEFQITDNVIGEKLLPWRRLIFAGKNENYSFIFYEQGGYVPHLTLIFFKEDGTEVLPITAYEIYARSDNIMQKQLFDFLKGQLPIKTIDEINNSNSRIILFKLRPEEYKSNL